MVCVSKRATTAAMRHILLLVVVFGSVVFFICERQHSLNAQIESMLGQVVELRDEQDKLAFLQERFANDVNKTARNIETQKNQIEILEQHSKRYNLKFLGIPEGNPDDPIALVKEIIEEGMGISLGDDIDDAYRINDDVKPRPILVKFSRWKDKTRVLYRRKSLPHSVEVEEDLTDNQKQAVRDLKDYADKAEKLGKKIRWNGKQLLVDGELVKLG